MFKMSVERLQEHDLVLRIYEASLLVETAQ